MPGAVAAVAVAVAVAVAAVVAVVAAAVVAAAVAALPGALAACAEADDLPTIPINEVAGRARHRRPGQSMCQLPCVSCHVFIASRLLHCVGTPLNDRMDF